jgi:hypothetical protein
MRRASILSAVLLLVACNSSVYVRDGVTDGDTFYLAPVALASNDAVLQSWVTYSLIRSTCKLTIGGENPARVSTYGCELTAREHLLDAWLTKRALGAPREDSYLDTLAQVREAGFLEEYVAYYLGRSGWQLPAAIDRDGFRDWRRAHLRGHKAETHLIGSWGYRESASAQRSGAFIKKS